MKKISACARSWVWPGDTGQPRSEVRQLCDGRKRGAIIVSPGAADTLPSAGVDFKPHCTVFTVIIFTSLVCVPDSPKQARISKKAQCLTLCLGPSIKNCAVPKQLLCRTSRSSCLERPSVVPFVMSHGSVTFLAGASLKSSATFHTVTRRGSRRDPGNHKRNSACADGLLSSFTTNRFIFMYAVL